VDLYALGTGLLRDLEVAGIFANDCARLISLGKSLRSGGMTFFETVLYAEDWDLLFEFVVKDFAKIWGGTLTWVAGRNQRVVWVGSHPSIESKFRDQLQDISWYLREGEIVSRLGSFESLDLFDPIQIGFPKPVSAESERSPDGKEPLIGRTQLVGRLFSFQDSEMSLVLTRRTKTFSDEEVANFRTSMKLLAAGLARIRRRWVAHREWWMEWGCARAASGSFFHNVIVKRGLLVEGEAETYTGVLTVAERRVVRLLASGYGTGEIAKGLGLSARTVEKHMENLMQKVGVRSRKRLLVELLSS
tara:strand:- start:845 stop:1753 length:909 start_codon:yes stop_codon:yes gene_type:complete